MVLKQCPVAGCGKWSNRWAKSDRGHPLPPVGSFSLLLQTEWATSSNNLVCIGCWERHTGRIKSLDGRTRIVHSSPLDVLMDAAAADSTSSSSPSTAAAAADADALPPPLSPPRLPPDTHSSQCCPPQSDPHPAPPLRPPRTVLSDITNVAAAHRQQSPARRHSTPLKRKREVVREVSQAATAAERDSVMEKLGVDHSTVSRYRKVVAKHNSRSKKGRERLTARRLAGGGRKPVLTQEQEAALEDWIMGQRKQKLRVTEKMVQNYARVAYKIIASDMWMQGFMKRHGLSMRLRTTTKEVNSEKLHEIVKHFRALISLNNSMC
jgi:hypothetical protein